jgi:HlyD family secretion protein
MAESAEMKRLNVTPLAMKGDKPAAPVATMDVARRRRWPTRRILAGIGVVVLLVVATSISAFVAKAPPTVPYTSVWVDVVRRGEFRREVGGPGRLVPEQVRWVQARTGGRVESIAVEAGALVEAETVLLQLSNPDLELQVGNAQSQLAQAVSALADLKAKLDLERLEHRSRLATLVTKYGEARRLADAGERLAAQKIISALEHHKTSDRAKELKDLLRIEEERAVALERAQAARLEARQAEVERLRALAGHHEALLGSLQGVAGLAGVVQELPLKVGQRVDPGTLLAKVINPSRLKVELKIPEKQAEEVEVGQRAQIEIENETVEGRVVRIDPAVAEGSVTVDVALDGELPRGARADLSVDGRIEIERLADVLYTGRPAHGKAETRVSLFRVGESGLAERTVVRFGGSSVSHIQVLEGVSEGDRVVLSDMSRWEAVDRLQLD